MTPRLARRVTPALSVVLAPNPGPMTLEGTNTWLIGADGPVVVVDPGPDDEAHLQAVLDHVGELRGRVVLTLLTHHHDDHTASADRWAAMTGAPVRGGGRGRPWHDGEEPDHGGVPLRVLATPGHTADSVSVLLPGERVLLTGDTVLGRGTSVVAHPDGDVGAYLRSLERLAQVVDEHDVELIAPGHGPEQDDPAAVLAQYRRHRLERLQQVREALAAGAADADDPVEAVVRSVYAQVPQEVWPAARLTVRAQLAYLEAEAG